MNYAVRLENLCAGYGKGRHFIQALHGISAQIETGMITGLMGPDGAGKTTLLRILAGLLAISAGSAFIFDKPPGLPGAHTGYMPQRFGLYEDLSVIANLQLYAALAGVCKNEREALFDKLLVFTNLAQFKKRLAGNLSGGMKQKLGIACALLSRPRLLLLDEPGVGVDPQSRRELWNMVQNLAADGMTVIWSTSYLDEAARCPRMIMLTEGRILFQGKPQEMIATVAGNVFLLKGSDSSGQAHRRELANWTVKQGIIDTQIQGSFLRLETAQDAENARKEILALGGAPAQATLEDAYMAAVGGMDKQPSPYSDIARISPPGESVIVADALTRKFGDFVAAHNISFEVQSGEIFGLLGPNGAGKSTTFRMLCGLLRPTSGACSVAGVDLLHSGSTARQKLGYMAQKFSLYPDISVKQNIDIFADLYNVSREKRAELLPGLIKALELEDSLSRKTHSLPLGLKQRLALLCATMHEPPALFLDEPTSGVDARARRDFWKHISALTTAGAAVLVTTHFMEEAEYCDQIGMIYRGAMIQRGSPDALKALVTNKPNPTLEDAFIACIETWDRDHPQ